MIFSSIRNKYNFVPQNKLRKSSTYFFIIIAISFLFSSCDTTSILEQNQYLHQKTKISLTKLKNTPKIPDLNANLLLLSRPILNRKFLGTYPLRLGIYIQTIDSTFFHLNKQLGNTAITRNKLSQLILNTAQNTLEDTRLVRNTAGWMHNKLGEPPVILDTLLIRNSTRSMTNYLYNKGFFNNKVNYSVDTYNATANVTYHINLNSPFYIDSVFYPQDTTIDVNKYLQQSKNESVLKKQEIFSVEKLNIERERIAHMLRAKGFYDFDANYVQFEIDTMQTPKKTNVYVNIKPPTEGVRHKVYKINRIYIYPDFDPYNPNPTFEDTIQTNEYSIIRPKYEEFTPSILINRELIKKGDVYSQINHDFLNKYYLSLGVFKFVNIVFKKNEGGAANYLDAFVYLSPSKPIKWGGEVELRNTNNSASNNLLGSAFIISYKNNNLFGGAQTLSVGAAYGIETPNFFKKDSSDATLINSQDVKADISLTTPWFLPNGIKNVLSKFRIISKYYTPRTVLSLGAEFNQRINAYKIMIANINFGYDWKQNNQIRHLLYPATLSYVLPTKDPNYNAGNIFEKSFERRIILGANYSLIYSSQKAAKLTNYNYLKINLDFAGNSLYLLMRAAKNQSQILGTTYSQFIRTELDARRYFVHLHHIIALRGAVALGIPYGNSTYLPYIKQYAIGGPNSIRAFKVRSLGPGTATDSSYTSELDRTGNFRIELNAEWRFDLASTWVKGALFADAGNVWKLGVAYNANEKINTISDLWTGTAIGIGAGIRLDYSYFVLRLDVAKPLKDPNANDKKQFVLTKFTGFGDLNLNLAIGYPF